MGICYQGELICYAIKTNPCFEVAGEILQCFEYRKTSCTTAHDNELISVHQVFISQIPGSTYRVLHIIDTPFTSEHFPVCPAVTSTAAVVNLQHPPTPAGEKLGLSIE